MPTTSNNMYSLFTLHVSIYIIIYIHFI
jgi:hypothetical protein